VAHSNFSQSSSHTPPPPKPTRLGQAFQWKSVALPWRKASGAAVTTGVLLGLGLLTGHWDYGVWAFMGAFTSIYVAPEPYRNRGQVLFWIALGLASAFALTSLTAASWWMTTLSLGLIAAGATFFTGAWRIPWPQSLMFILVGCISAALPVDPGHTWLKVSWVLVGGAAAWLQGMVGWLIHRHKPEATAVHHAYRAITAYFAAIATASSVECQHQAALALRRADDSVAAMRARTSGHQAAYRLVWLADQAQDLFQAIVALAAKITSPPPASWVATLAALADGHPVGPPPTPDDRPEWERLRQQVERSAAAIHARLPKLWTVRTSPLPSVKSRMQEALTEPRVISTTWRIAIGVTAAGLLGHVLGEAHPYWVPLTVGAILQGSTAMTMIGRSLARVVGTIVGLGLALGFLLLHPSLVVFLIAVVIFQFTMLLFIVRNYAVAVALITAMALVIISSEAVVPPWPMVSARFIDTLAGALVALACLRFLWPQAASDRLGSVLADTIRQSGRLLDRSLAKASSTELSKTSRNIWWRPRLPLSPTYIPGRFRTASKPSNTWILSAL